MEDFIDIEEREPEFDGEYQTINRFDVVGESKYIAGQWFRDGIEIRITGWKDIAS